MEETEAPHPEYLKGFNEGYLITKHLPDLADKLSGVLGDSLWGTGFQDGRQQLILEQVKDRLPDWLKDDPLSRLDNLPDKSHEKDRDDLDR